jgi:hypothetical protein
VAARVVEWVVEWVVAITATDTGEAATAASW